MTFQKLDFESALKQGQLAVETKDGERITREGLERMTVNQLLETNITLYGAALRLSLHDQTHWLEPGSFAGEEQKKNVRKHPESVEVYWRGGSSSQFFPAEPKLPESNALVFLRNEYNSQMSGVNDEGKICLD